MASKQANTLRLHVNGSEVEAETSSDTLLDVLREQLELAGAKKIHTRTRYW